MQSTIAALLADKRNTRLALATALAERNAECQALRTQLSTASAPKAKPLSRVVPAREPRTLPAAFIAARELAMRTGQCVRVGA